MSCMVWLRQTMHKLLKREPSDRPRLRSPTLLTLTSKNKRALALNKPRRVDMPKKQLCVKGCKRDEKEIKGIEERQELEGIKKMIKWNNIYIYIYIHTHTNNSESNVFGTFLWSTIRQFWMLDLVVKQTNHTGLWDAELAWYSLNATHWICRCREAD